MSMRGAVVGFIIGIPLGLMLRPSFLGAKLSIRQAIENIDTPLVGSGMATDTLITVVATPIVCSVIGFLADRILRGAK